jgi:uncharacterized protein YeaO (DUF488 family)
MRRGVRVKRIYAPVETADGTRVLVDRLWPRGVGRADACLDLWLKTVAPSPRLREWFDHRPERWEPFQRRYLAELAVNPSVEVLADLVARGQVTLLYAARDETHNHARVLAQLLGRRASSDRRPTDAQWRRKALARWENEGGAEA